MIVIDVGERLETELLAHPCATASAAESGRSMTVSERDPPLLVETEDVHAFHVEPATVVGETLVSNWSVTPRGSST